MKYTILNIVKNILLVVSSFISLNIYAQNYLEAYNKIEQLLKKSDSHSFKDAVLIVENCYLDGSISEEKFNDAIKFIKNILEFKSIKNSYNGYFLKDSSKIKMYNVIFNTFTDTTRLKFKNDSMYFSPFRYNFEDMFGEKDWSNMFVTKLLATHKGNCHSMPYLYKILCEELGIPCYLALSPNHIYIKHRSEKVGMYNTELTSASFPIDAWIMASGYITLEAIQNGIYMEALDDKKCITLCVYDLAKGYDRKYPDNDGTFIIKCCDLALEHFPNFINALILKAETKKKQFERLAKERNLTTAIFKQQKEGKTLWEDMTKQYNEIHTLGYRAMPEKMYLDWLTSLQKEREKYGNKQVSEMNRN